MLLTKLPLHPAVQEHYAARARECNSERINLTEKLVQADQKVEDLREENRRGNRATLPLA